MDLWIYIYICIYDSGDKFYLRKLQSEFSLIIFQKEGKFNIFIINEKLRELFCFARQIHSQTFQTCVLQYGMKRSSLKANFIRRTNLVHSSLDSLQKTVLLIVSRRSYLEFIFVYIRILTECNVHVHEREKNYNFVPVLFPSLPLSSLPSLSFFLANTDFILRGWYANETELMVACLSAGDEEWDDGNEQNVLEVTEQDNEGTGIKRECC